MRDGWDWWVRGYYGPGGRTGTRRRPNRGRVGEREGDLAIATVHSSESSRDMEIEVLNARDDIGDVNWGGGPQEVVVVLRWESAPVAGPLTRGCRPTTPAVHR